MTETTLIAVELGISPRSSMLSGYSGDTRQLDEIDERWSWRVLHVEMKRRHVAAFFSHPNTVRIGVDDAGLPVLVTPMGVGSAGRTANAGDWANFWSRHSRTPLPGRPSRWTPQGRAWLLPGKAPMAYPGSSVHNITYEDRAMSVDMVGWQDGWINRRQVLKPWRRQSHRFGLKTFHNVNGEPWHTQLDGYPNSRSDLIAALAVRPLERFELPRIPLAATPTPPPAPATPIPPEPADLEEDDMYFISHPNHGATWACTPGAAARVAHDVFKAKFADGVPHIVTDDEEQIAWCERMSGRNRLEDGETSLARPKRAGVYQHPGPVAEFV